MTYVKNEYVGGQEYIISFGNGAHYVKEVAGEDLLIVFTGHYEDCINYLNKLQEEYRESLY